MPLEKLTDRPCPQALSLLASTSFPPTFAFSAAEGVIPGDVFADLKDEPGNLIMRTHAGICYAAGAVPGEAALTWLEGTIESSSLSGGRFTLFAANDAWDQAIQDRFGCQLNRYRRFAFDFKDTAQGSAGIGKLPEEFELKEIDRQAILRDPEFNEAYYEEYWGSAERFLELGTGFCCTYKGQIASTCTTIFASLVSGVYEADIATVPAFQGKGLARHVAHAFIERCLALGMKPGWDCSADNEASIKLAKRLGFEKGPAYSVFTIK